MTTLERDINTSIETLSIEDENNNASLLNEITISSLNKIIETWNTSKNNYEWIRSLIDQQAFFRTIELIQHPLKFKKLNKLIYQYFTIVHTDEAISLYREFKAMIKNEFKRIVSVSFSAKEGSLEDINYIGSLSYHEKLFCILTKFVDFDKELFEDIDITQFSLFYCYLASFKYTNIRSIQTLRWLKDKDLLMIEYLRKLKDTTNPSLLNLPLMCVFIEAIGPELKKMCIDFAMEYCSKNIPFIKSKLPQMIMNEFQYLVPQIEQESFIQNILKPLQKLWLRNTELGLYLCINIFTVITFSPETEFLEIFWPAFSNFAKSINEHVRKMTSDCFIYVFRHIRNEQVIYPTLQEVLKFAYSKLNIESKSTVLSSIKALISREFSRELIDNIIELLLYSIAKEENWANLEKLLSGLLVFTRENFGHLNEHQRNKLFSTYQVGILNKTELYLVQIAEFLYHHRHSIEKILFMKELLEIIHKTSTKLISTSMSSITDPWLLLNDYFFIYSVLNYKRGMDELLPVLVNEKKFNIKDIKYWSRLSLSQLQIILECIKSIYTHYANTLTDNFEKESSMTIFYLTIQHKNSFDFLYLHMGICEVINLVQDKRKWVKTMIALMIKEYIRIEKDASLNKKEVDDNSTIKNIRTLLGIILHMNSKHLSMMTVECLIILCHSYSNYHRKLDKILRENQQVIQENKLEVLQLLQNHYDSSDLFKESKQLMLKQLISRCNDVSHMISDLIFNHYFEALCIRENRHDALTYLEILSYDKNYFNEHCYSKLIGFLFPFIKEKDTREFIMNVTKRCCPVHLVKVLNYIQNEKIPSENVLELMHALNEDEIMTESNSIILIKFVKSLCLQGRMEKSILICSLKTLNMTICHFNVTHKFYKGSFYELVEYFYLIMDTVSEVEFIEIEKSMESLVSHLVNSGYQFRDEKLNRLIYQELISISQAKKIFTLKLLLDAGQEMICNDEKLLPIIWIYSFEEENARLQELCHDILDSKYINIEDEEYSLLSSTRYCATLLDFINKEYISSLSLGKAMASLGCLVYQEASLLNMLASCFQSYENHIKEWREAPKHLRNRAAEKLKLTSNERERIAMIIECVVNSLTLNEEEDREILQEATVSIVLFLLDIGLTEINEPIYTKLFNTGLLLINKFGGVFHTQLMPLLDQYLQMEGLEDRVKEGVVIYLGLLGKYIRFDKESGTHMKEKLLATMKTPNESVQFYIAEALVPLFKMDTIDELRELLEKYWSMLGAKEIGYGERKGTAFVIASICRSGGLDFVHKLEIMRKLQLVFENGVPGKRESFEGYKLGGYMVIQSCFQIYGELFEPYLPDILPYLITGFSSSNEKIRDECQYVCQTLMKNTSTVARKLLGSWVLQIIEKEKNWRSKCNLIQLMSALCLDSDRMYSMIEVILHEIWQNSHPNLISVCKDILSKVCQRQRHPELKRYGGAILNALFEPNAFLSPLMTNLCSLSLTQYIDTLSLVLLSPNIERSIKEKSSEMKRKAALLIGNISCLLPNIERDVLENVWNSWIQSLIESLGDPSSKTRETTAKTIAILLRIWVDDDDIGKGEVKNVLEQLYKKVGDGSVNYIDRCGSAQCISEIYYAFGLGSFSDCLTKLHHLLATSKGGREGSGERHGGLLILFYLPKAFEILFFPLLEKALALMFDLSLETSEAEQAWNALKSIYQTFSLFNWIIWYRHSYYGTQRFILVDRAPKGEDLSAKEGEIIETFDIRKILMERLVSLLWNGNDPVWRSLLLELLNLFIESRINALAPTLQNMDTTTESSGYSNIAQSQKMQWLAGLFKEIYDQHQYRQLIAMLYSFRFTHITTVSTTIGSCGGNVRTLSMNLWKAFIDHTPRALKEAHGEILTFLIERSSIAKNYLKGGNIGSNEEDVWKGELDMTRKAFDDLIAKMGDRLMLELVKALFNSSEHALGRFYLLKAALDSGSILKDFLLQEQFPLLNAFLLGCCHADVTNEAIIEQIVELIAIIDEQAGFTKIRPFIIHLLNSATIQGKEMRLCCKLLEIIDNEMLLPIYFQFCGLVPAATDQSEWNQGHKVVFIAMIAETLGPLFGRHWDILLPFVYTFDDFELFLTCCKAIFVPIQESKANSVDDEDEEDVCSVENRLSHLVELLLSQYRSGQYSSLSLLNTLIALVKNLPEMKYLPSYSPLSFTVLQPLLRALIMDLFRGDPFDHKEEKERRKAISELLRVWGSSYLKKWYDDIMMQIVFSSLDELSGAGGDDNREIDWMAQKETWSVLVPIFILALTANSSEEMRTQTSVTLLQILEVYVSSFSDDHHSQWNFEPEVKVLVGLVGPCIRVLGERVNVQLKSLLIHCLVEILKLMMELKALDWMSHIKPFWPQLQRVFLKSLVDASFAMESNDSQEAIFYWKGITVRSAEGLRLLVKGMSRLELILKELVPLLQSFYQLMLNSTFLDKEMGDGGSSSNSIGNDEDEENFGDALVELLKDLLLKLKASGTELDADALKPLAQAYLSISKLSPTSRESLVTIQHLL